MSEFITHRVDKEDGHYVLTSFITITLKSNLENLPEDMRDEQLDIVMKYNELKIKDKMRQIVNE